MLRRVGGLAVVLHGHARLTADVDLVIDLAPEEARNAIAALEELGFKPRLPVEAADFADPEKRLEWRRSKGMRVFSMYDPRDPLAAVDLFVDNSSPSDELLRRSVEIEVSGTRVPVACIDDPIERKRERSTDGWAAHEEDQLARWLEATPVQRLEWLEEALRLAHETGALRRDTDDTADNDLAAGNDDTGDNEDTDEEP